MERGCYLSQTKQSGELFCRGDTMRQRQLPTTYSKSQVRAMFRYFDFIFAIIGVNFIKHISHEYIG